MPYYGAGAGSEPTASAVVADVIDIVRALTSDPENRVPHLAFQPGELSDMPILPMEEVETAYYLRMQAIDRPGVLAEEEVETAYYLRMQAIDRPGVLAEVTKILGDSGISIEAILQKEPEVGATHVPIIFLTQRVQEKNMNEAIAKIKDLDVVDGDITRIRMETLS